MTVVLVAICSVIAFLVAFAFLGVVAKAKEAIGMSQGAVKVIKDPSLSDLEREKRVQRASLGLLGLFVSILLRSVASLALAAAPILITDAAGFTDAELVVAFLSRWDVIVGLSILIVIALVLWHRMQKGR